MWNEQNSTVLRSALMGVCLLLLLLIETTSAEKSAETDPNLRANTSEESVSTHGEDLWKQLGLVHTEIHGSQIWYDPSFEDKLSEFEDFYGQFLQSTESVDRPDPPALDPNQVLTRLGQILGTDESLLEKMKPILGGMLNLPIPMGFGWNSQQATLVFPDQKKVKSFLREGGRLPGYITYDKATDTAVYKMKGMLPDLKSSSSPPQWILPIGPDVRFEHEIKTIFEKMLGANGMSPGVPIHEAAELALVLSIKPEDRYCRWFSDGVANVVAAQILDEMIGPEAANEFLKEFSTEPYEDLKGKINLRFWMASHYCIETELEDETRLGHARYAYATYEIQRLVDEHGLDCIRKITDILDQQLSVTSRTIVGAIHKVTGEDMNERLTNYQQFKSPQEAGSLYGSAYIEAVKAEDYHSALSAVLRMMELQTSLLSRSGLILYVRATGLLAKIGREEEANAAMENCIELFTNSTMRRGREAAIATFLPYTMQTKKSQILVPYAEEMLQSDPNHLLGLAIKMLSLAQAEDLSQAQEYAKRVMSLNPGKYSDVYKMAKQVLDAKQPVKVTGKAELRTTGKPGYLSVDLSSFYNRPHNSVRVGGNDNASFKTWFTQDRVSADGVPFQVQRAGNDVLVSKNNTQNVYEIQGLDTSAESLHFLVWGYMNPTKPAQLRITFSDGTVQECALDLTEWTRGVPPRTFDFENTVQSFRYATVAYQIINVAYPEKTITSIASISGKYGLIAITLERQLKE
jgi:hypothetical protein